MFWTVIATSLLAVQAQAGSSVERSMAEAAILAARGTDNIDSAMQHLDRRMPVDNVNDNMPRYASESESSEIEYANRVVMPRAAANASGTTDIGNGVILNADGTINMTAWDNTATVACNIALAKLPESSNPSGTCTCYNLPALNNVTGAFEADLRLYQISTPRGTFSGISPENIQVGLSYSGASVSPVSVATASKLVIGRDTSTSSNTTTPGLKILQQYLFVGQINKDLMTTSMDMAQLEALVMPLVTLTATNTDGTTVATNVSSNEAAFVAGVFSDAVVMSDTTRAQAAVADVVTALSNRTVAFVVPGVQLILFPIGLIITSVWLAIGVVAIGMGFVQRVSFRESYRTRAMQSVKGGAGRI
ncbi:hypothetical protein F503_06061 [Ophiostoma piceae UAMH 11346]|uniref:Uncharacterized protein n=1 Tax=Ophiostoma piceae (strain UAMH 11346) TaxID=1262450 RepID=S3CFN0_OPHP1|nr:hypothetical protein F503_06061 [Ophiostoma piceae UAMH 11346]